MDYLVSGEGGGPPVRKERRLLPVEVKAVKLVTPHMKRITVGSDALRDFGVTRPAQWVKVFVPTKGSDRPSGRAYTIRSFFERDAEMDIDFVLHGDGPCSSWAEHAQVGDVIQIAGPRAGFRLDTEVHQLLIGGDETALPAIGSILEALPREVSAKVFIEIPEDSDSQSIRSKADVSIVWLSRHGAAAGTRTILQEAIMDAPLPEGGSVWFSAESFAVRTIRRHFYVVRGLDRRRVISFGYWQRGEIDFRDAEGDQ
jgi:NADPH-dependent ferric siderophore reductase